MKEVNNLDKFIEVLRLTKEFKPSQLSGKVSKIFPDSCGTNYNILYSFNGVATYEENIRIDHDDRETPKICIKEKIDYIQKQLKNETK